MGKDLERRISSWRPVVGKIDLEPGQYPPFQSFSTTDAKDRLCANCLTRPAAEQWVGEGGYLAYSHGMSSWWCTLCVAKASLEYARKQAERIPTLEAEVARLEAESTA